MIDRPSWDSYFLDMAALASTRSPDEQTKCGCVIVDKQNKILSQGYNGFPRGLNDEELPTTRPDKYPWMIHAEVNALLNCNASLHKAKAYITTNPCFNCLVLMWQAGIDEVVYSTDGDKPHMIDNEEYKTLAKRFIDMSGMGIEGYAK